MDAASLRSRYGMAARIRPTVPIMSVSKLAFQLAGAGMASALTFATTMSTPPSAPAASSTHFCMPCSSATSRTCPATLRPCLVNASTVSVTSAAVRAETPTAAPSADSASTMARPIPRVPPVTRARRPCRPRSTSLPPSLG